MGVKAHGVLVSTMDRTWLTLDGGSWMTLYGAAGLRAVESTVGIGGMLEGQRSLWRLLVWTGSGAERGGSGRVSTLLVEDVNHGLALSGQAQRGFG